MSTIEHRGSRVARFPGSFRTIPPFSPAQHRVDHRGQRKHRVWTGLAVSWSVPDLRELQAPFLAAYAARCDHRAADEIGVGHVKF